MAECCHSEDSAPGSDKRVVQPDKSALLARLARMVEEDRYCVDILTQLAAARAALNGVAMQLLTHHAHGCVQQAIQSGEGEAALDELMATVKKLL